MFRHTLVVAMMPFRVEIEIKKSESESNKYILQFNNSNIDILHHSSIENKLLY